MQPLVRITSLRCATNLNHLCGYQRQPTPLLVGVALENKSKFLSIPLTLLPTTLGKEHETEKIGLIEYNSSDGDKAEGGSSTNKTADQNQCAALFIIEVGNKGASWAATRRRIRQPQLMRIRW